MFELVDEQPQRWLEFYEKQKATRRNRAMSCTATGLEAEMVVADYLNGRGIEVFVPLNRRSSCDLIALVSHVPVRIEVKSGIQTLNGSALRRDFNPEHSDVRAYVFVDGSLSFEPVNPRG